VASSSFLVDKDDKSICKQDGAVVGFILTLVLDFLATETFPALLLVILLDLALDASLFIIYLVF